jgi:hypothetical protein
MSLSPFDVIKCINEKSDPLITQETEKEYNPFIVNRGLSFMRETVMYAAEMNKYHGMDKLLQFDFYYNAIPKGKRFAKWQKRETLDEDVKMIADIYCCSEKIALQYLDLLDETSINTIRKMMEHGGNHGRKSSRGNS